MKLVTFQDRRSTDLTPRIGAIAMDGASAVDLQRAAELHFGHTCDEFVDMTRLLESGAGAMEKANDLIEFAERENVPELRLAVNQIRLLSPVPRPASIRDCMSFQRHLVQATRTVVRWRSRPLAALDGWLERHVGHGIFRVPKVWFERPVYYKGNPRSVVGTEAEIRWPSFTEKLDFELEFGIFIGRAGHNISEADAHGHIGGYALFNDFSARDIQLREMQGRLGPAKGKDFDTSNAIGPWLVTPDEIADPYDLTMSVRVNGEEWSCCATREMHFTFDQLIAYVSQDETLYPGDFIGAGTLPSGCGLELDRWIQPGDVVELVSDQLGVLRNRVVRVDGA